MNNTLQQQVEFFMENGYYVVKKALNPDHVQQIIEVVNTISEGIKGREIPDIIDRDEIFHPLLVHPPTFHLIKALMGPKIQMESVNATRVKGGSGLPVGWHVDSHPYPDPLPPLWYFPVSVNCVYYLDDITTEKGPLMVLPKSHLSGQNPLVQDSIPGEVEVCAESGDAVVFHGALWHAAKPNFSNDERRALYFNYIQCFCKQRENNFQGEISKRLRESGPFFKQQLLGKFDGWHEIPADADEN